MTRQGQCVTCVRWARQGGSILPAVEGCGWLADHDARPLSGAVRMLLPVLDPSLVGAGIGLSRLVGSLVPVILGNIVGGAVLVAQWLAQKGYVGA